MKGQTQSTKIGDVKRTWHMIDLKDQILGRVSSQIAQLLMGKSKSYFVRNLDCGDYVVVVNAKNIKVSGKKEGQKVYYRYSGYPGGLSKATLAEVRVKKPQDIIIHAVKGMLPQNRLRDKMLTRLFVFPEAEHGYEDKFKNQNAKVKSEK